MEAIKATIQSIMQAIEKKVINAPSDGPERLLQKFLSKKALKHIKVNYFRKGILSINVDSSAWLFNLALKKEDLLDRLNKKTNPVKDIHFRIGEVK